MNRNKILGKLVFDYNKFFNAKDVKKHCEEFTEFNLNNKELSNDECYERFQIFYLKSDLINSAISRKYLSNIASIVKTIKIIVVIYFIDSFIGAFFLASKIS